MYLTTVNSHYLHLVVGMCFSSDLILNLLGIKNHGFDIAPCDELFNVSNDNF